MFLGVFDRFLTVAGHTWSQDKIFDPKRKLLDRPKKKKEFPDQKFFRPQKFLTGALGIFCRWQKPGIWRENWVSAQMSVHVFFWRLRLRAQKLFRIAHVPLHQTGRVRDKFRPRALDMRTLRILCFGRVFDVFLAVFSCF